MILFSFHFHQSTYGDVVLFWGFALKSTPAKHPSALNAAVRQHLFGLFTFPGGTPCNLQGAIVKLQV